MVSLKLYFHTSITFGHFGNSKLGLSALGQYTYLPPINVSSDKLLVTVHNLNFTMKAVLLLSVLASAFAAPDTRLVISNITLSIPNTGLFHLQCHSQLIQTLFCLPFSFGQHKLLIPMPKMGYLLMLPVNSCCRFLCSECVDEMHNLGFLVRAGAHDIRVSQNTP